MLILGLDYETCGSPEKPPFFPTELGMVLMDVSSYRVVRTQTFLIQPGVEVSSELLQMTHLTQAQLNNHGLKRDVAAEGLYLMMQEAQAIVTWNGDGFDDRLAQQELTEFIGPCATPPWIDLKIDCGFSHKLTLTHAAADMSYLNPCSHSALGDVLTLFEVARRKNFDFATALQNAQSPYVEVLAQVSYETRDQASEAGYRWAPERRIWVRKVRQNMIEAEAALRPFLVRQVPDESVKEPIQSKGNVQ